MTRRIAIVDMGTNTLKFSVTEIDDQVGGSVVDAHAETVRLGAGIAASGIIDPDRAAQALQLLWWYEQRARALGAEAFIGVATAALRMASNGDDLLDRIARMTEWQVEVISGEEEARLTFVGLLHLMPIQGNAIIIDVGGGSSEIIAVANRTMIGSESLNIGSGTLADRIFNLDPPGIDAVNEATKAALSVLESSRTLHLADQSAMFLSGGNGEFLSRFAGWNEVSVPFTPGAFPDLLSAIAIVESARLAAYLGIARNRAQMLPAGAAIAMASICIAHPLSVKAVPSGIRGGLIADWIASRP